MKSLVKILPSVALLIMTSCQDVIDLDLNDAAPKYVIEGLITDTSEVTTVKISQTTDYFNPTIPPSVSDAEITLSDDAGNSDVLKEGEKGVYSNRKIKPIYGRMYTLTVKIGGNTFTAQTKMPQTKVEIASLSNRKSILPFGATDTADQQVFLKFQDTPNQSNNYRFRLKINGVFEKDIEIQTDSRFITDGKLSELPFRFSRVKAGDKVEAELWCIDESLFAYYTTLNKILSDGGLGGGTAAPANPDTNIKGGALGYFGAVAISSKAFEVK